MRASEAAYRRTVTLAFLLAVVVSTLGAYVRLSNAGLSCPDWPGCYGRLGVPGPDDAASAQAAFPERPLDRARAWKEMAHRYAAGLLGLAVMLIGVLAWRRSPPGRIPALPCFLVVLVAFQALLGMWTVTLGLAPLVVTAHLLAGLATVALLWWLRLGLVRRAGVSGPVFRGGRTPAIRTWALGGVLIIALQIALGGWTSANYAALACPDFPLCQARLLPPLDLPGAFAPWPDADGGDFEGGVRDNDARVTIHLAHRLGAVLTLLYVNRAHGADLRLGRGRPPQGRGGGAAGRGDRAGIPRYRQRLARIADRDRGGTQRGGHPPAPLRAHCVPYGSPARLPARGTIRGADLSEHAAVLGTSPLWKEYLELTKPRVVTVLAFTALVGVCLASPGALPLDTAVFALLGISLAAAAGGAVNHVVDRRVDALMPRTRRRPLPQGRVTSTAALAFAGGLSVLSVLLLGALVNWLTTVLTFASMVGYSVVYTMYLKRATPQNIVIGGAAGAMPPVLGWTAVTGSVDGHAMLLFVIIFAWTPPHFWALAIERREEYARAEIPMLPVTHGVPFTRLQILLYTVILFGVSLLPFVARMSGTIYLAGAVLLGAAFLYQSVMLYLGRSGRGR